MAQGCLQVFETEKRYPELLPWPRNPRESVIVVCKVTTHLKPNSISNKPVAIIEGSPKVDIYECTNSTFYKVASAAAA